MQWFQGNKDKPMDFGDLFEHCNYGSHCFFQATDETLPWCSLPRLDQADVISSEEVFTNVDAISARVAACFVADVDGDGKLGAEAMSELVVHFLACVHDSKLCSSIFWCRQFLVRLAVLDDVVDERLVDLESDLWWKCFEGNRVIFTFRLGDGCYHGEDFDDIRSELEVDL